MSALGANWLELVELAVAALATGAVSGFLAGLFGIGGGAILVPVLYQVLGVVGVDEAIRMHLALGTSMGVVLPTAIRSWRAHTARGTVDGDVLRRWVIVVPLGVVAASAVAATIPGGGLRAIFGTFTLLIALKLLFGRDDLRLGAALPRGPVNAVVGAAIGFVSTLMGVGGGVFATLYMTLFGRPLLNAISTSAGVGALIAIPATVGYIVAGWGHAALPPGSLGFVNVLGIAFIIPVAILSTPLGVRIAHAMPRRTLEIAFGCFLLLVSARFLATLIW